MEGFFLAVPMLWFLMVPIAERIATDHLVPKEGALFNAQFFQR